jgi:hypothetical protein
MVNIQDYWPSVIDTNLESTVARWTTILDNRREIGQAFTTIESERGFCQPQVSFATMKGQEILRIMFFRVLEEAAESYMSEDVDHIREEAIDAINYLLLIPLLDGTVISQQSVAEIMDMTARHVFMDVSSCDRPLEVWDLGVMTELVCGHLADTFRNRPWMHNAQDLYFSGDEQLKRALIGVGGRLLRVFPDFATFWVYYHAKASVLRFRLETHY